MRAGYDWCAKRELPPLPMCGQDVAAFLAAQRRREMAPNTIDLRHAAIPYLHRAAAAKGQSQEKKFAATAAIIQQLLAALQDDLRGKRDRTLLLVGFAGRCAARS